MRLWPKAPGGRRLRMDTRSLPPAPPDGRGSPRDSPARLGTRALARPAYCRLRAANPGQGRQRPARQHAQESSGSRRGLAPQRRPLSQHLRAVAGPPYVIRNVTILTAAGPPDPERLRARARWEDRRRRRIGGGAGRRHGHRRPRQGAHAGHHRHALAPGRLPGAGRGGAERRQRGRRPPSRPTSGPSTRCGRRTRSSRATSPAASPPCRSLPGSANLIRRPRRDAQGGAVRARCRA